MIGGFRSLLCVCVFQGLCVAFDRNNETAAKNAIVNVHSEVLQI